MAKKFKQYKLDINLQQAKTYVLQFWASDSP